MKDFLTDSLMGLEEYKNLVKNLKSGLSPLAAYGLGEESLGHIVFGLKSHLAGQAFLISYDNNRARKIYEDLRGLDCPNVYLFPKKEMVFYNVDAHSNESSKERLKVLSKLSQGEDIFVISSIEALRDIHISKEIFQEAFLRLELGQDINLENLLEDLNFSGYERVHMVEDSGQFSIRGGILDIFPPDQDNPYRLEFFDTEIDSIRIFDPFSQRSIEKVEEIIIPPSQEILIDERNRKKIIAGLEKDLSKPDINQQAEEKFFSYFEQIKEGSIADNRKLLLPYMDSKSLGSSLSYLDNKSLVFFDDISRIREESDSLEESAAYRIADLLQEGEVLPSHKNLNYSYPELLPDLDNKRIVTFASLLKSDPDFPPKYIGNFSIRSGTAYHRKLDILAEDLKHNLYRGYKILILMASQERGKRLQKDLEGYGVVSSFYHSRQEEIKSGQVFIGQGRLDKGFSYPHIKFQIISEKDIFSSIKEKRKKRRKIQDDKVLNLSDLKVGDYIVHEGHGIGRYEGIEQLDIQGIKKDYLNIRYRGTDKLYIPTDQMTMLQKYIGSEGIKPRVNKLNSGEWQRTKAKTKKALEDMAEELIELYATRDQIQGFAFSPDSPWQAEFEENFHYQETEGQLQAVEEIKADMEASKPMDRLLCGDVGYGKTEVALRAAFKAIMDGKQVAILVPTTILAQQHYNTIKERFSDFPVSYDILSRFRTPKQTEKSLEKLKEGNIDILVGTHRLLSKDVKFKDLGLLIVDEEQRFGVKHKEKLKALRENVDVLTLTATPIPRTLHMSLAGIRDMSVIEDPPAERYPIQTYVLEYKPQMIREAILREMARGGQVYFLYNRVATIDRMALQLKELIPEANIAVGHGQMGQRQLEKIMLDFVEGKQDVLVSTTIIESGLDIENVNTIIVYSADKMGLAQLYQLRGRVGRSNKLAYGYFTYQENKILTEVAEKRLRAISEFTAFGSGFKIAMRDLEIRGAGNLLGAQQHGHIGAIGYDLYVKLLGQAVKRLKGEEVKEELDTTIDLKVAGYIPTSYIEDEEIRIQIYKKIAIISDMDEYWQLIDELTDRFGDPAEVVENLIKVSYIKAIASKNGIKSISQGNYGIRLELTGPSALTLESINFLSKKYGRQLDIDLSSKAFLNYRETKDPLKNLKQLVEEIDSFSNKKKEAEENSHEED